MNTQLNQQTDTTMRNYDRLAEKFQRELEAEITQKQMDRVQRAIQSSGLSKAIDVMTFDTFQTDMLWQQKSKELAVRYANDPKRWFIACGQSGSGKTHLCTAIAGKLLRDGVPVHYMLWRQDVMRAVGINGEEYRRQLRTCPVLYIDDLFKGGTSQIQIQIAFDILDARYREEKRTILSTEYNLRDLVDIDEAIYGRIKQMARNQVINIGKDASRNWRTKC